MIFSFIVLNIVILGDKNCPDPIHCGQGPRFQLTAVASGLGTVRLDLAKGGRCGRTWGPPTFFFLSFLNEAFFRFSP